MKKVTLLTLALIGPSISLFSCNKQNNEKYIRVCASEIPHAQILNGIVKDELAKKGFTLDVKVLDWSFQNEQVANKDYDANYFQHRPYLNSYLENASVKLFMTCTVHYEPLGIYQNTSKSNKNIEICKDDSNAVRAINLLYENGYLSTKPVNQEGTKVTFSDTFTDPSTGYTIKLIEESILVQSRVDYELACLPFNTALTGNVSDSPIKVENERNLVTKNANGLVCRDSDYKSDTTYAAKINALTDVLISNEVSTYIATTWNGKIVCNSDSQIDYRGFSN